MSRASSAAIDVGLTAYAQGLSNDLVATSKVALALCPKVIVNGGTGQFKKFDDGNSFRSYDTVRPLGAGAKRIEFDAEDGEYNCEPQALEISIDDHERLLSGAPKNPLANELLEQGRVKALVSSTALSVTSKIVDFVLDNTTPVPDRGNWADDSIDPIDQLDEQLEALSLEVGATSPINLVIGLSAWRTLRMHPKVKARHSQIATAITTEMMAACLMFPVTIVIGSVSRLTSGIGQSTRTKAQLLGDNVILTYSVENPTVYDPSAFKLFTTANHGLVPAVKFFREDLKRSDVFAVDWSEDIQLTSPVSVKRLAIT